MKDEGNVFRAMRIRAGLKQTEVAELLEICKSTVCMWEKGKSRPKFRTLVKLTKLYKCSVAELMNWE